MNTAHIIQYNRAVAVVKDLPKLLANNDKIWTSFQYFTKSDYHHVINFLKTDTTPNIVPVWNLVRGNAAYGNTPVGANNPLTGVAIEIEQNLLYGLENAKLKSTIYNTGFLLSVTLLHELVHFIRKVTNLPSDYEYGEGFELNVFGNLVDIYNSSALNHYQQSFHHLKWAIRNDKVINDNTNY